MFKALFTKRGPLGLYAVFYTYGPGTYVLKRIVIARSEAEADLVFDETIADSLCHRLPGKTCKATEL
jgi:hypothetical protein